MIEPKWIDKREREREKIQEKRERACRSSLKLWPTVMSDDCWRRLEAIEEQTCWEVKEPVHLHASGARIAQRRTWPLASLSTVTRCLEIY